MTQFRTVDIADPRFVRDDLHVMTVKSPALARRVDLSIYVPPQLPPDAPLILLLHGVYGSHWGWALKGGAHLTAARMIAAGALPPAVVAMPSDGLWGDGSGYVPHADANYETWILDEVPAAVARLAGEITSASPICIAGLSMGGFGALRLAGKYPGRYAAAAAHSSITRVEQFRGFIEEDWRAWSASPSDASIAGAFAAAGGPTCPIRFDCGVDDPMLGANRRLHADLTALGVAHDYVEYEGGHDWSYWERHLPDTLGFFASVLTAGRGRISETGAT